MSPSGILSTVITILPIDDRTNPDWSINHVDNDDCDVNNSDWLTIVMITLLFTYTMNNIEDYFRSLVSCT